MFSQGWALCVHLCAASLYVCLVLQTGLTNAHPYVVADLKNPVFAKGHPPPASESLHSR